MRIYSVGISYKCPQSPGLNQVTYHQVRVDEDLSRPFTDIGRVQPGRRGLLTLQGVGVTRWRAGSRD